MLSTEEDSVGIKGEHNNLRHQDVDGICTICTEALVYGKEGDGAFEVDRENQKPLIKIGCGHVFHAECLRNHLRARWPEQNISWRFLRCP